MRNQFLGFANQIIAQHTQGGGPFDSAAMIFPEAAEQYGFLPLPFHC